MATTTLTLNPELITVPANTTEHDINFDDILKKRYGTALIERVSGTSVQLNSNGVAISALAPAIIEANPKMVLPIKKGTNIRMKGGAGSETFMVTIHPDGDGLQR